MAGEGEGGRGRKKEEFISKFHSLPSMSDLKETIAEFHRLPSSSDLKETKLPRRSFSCADEVLVANWEFEILKGKSVLKFQELELKDVVITPLAQASELSQNSFSHSSFYWRLRLTYKNEMKGTTFDKHRFEELISALAEYEEVCIYQSRETEELLELDLEAKTLFLLSLVQVIKSLSRYERAKAQAVRIVRAFLISVGIVAIGVGMELGIVALSKL